MFIDLPVEEHFWGSPRGLTGTTTGGSDGGGCVTDRGCWGGAGAVTEAITGGSNSSGFVAGRGRYVGTGAVTDATAGGGNGRRAFIAARHNNLQ